MTTDSSTLATPDTVPTPWMTVSEAAKYARCGKKSIYNAVESKTLRVVLGKIHSYRLTNICAFKLPATDPVVTFGDTPLDRLTLDHIEAFRDARKAAGLSAVAVNHDLKLLRSMFNWGIRRG
jgi:hypothetical protein